MKTRSRTLVTIVGGVAVAASLTLSGCTASGEVAPTDECTPTAEVTTVKPGVLTVALTNTPPYSFEDGNAISGIDGDLVTAFAAEECLSVEYAPYDYPGAIEATTQGRVDLSVGGFYRTQARADVVTLSDPLYLDQLAIYSTAGYSTIDDLAGKTIGTVEGYLWVDDLKALEGVTTQTYPDSVSLAEDLKAGRIDAALDGYAAAVSATQGEDYTIQVVPSDDRVASTNEPAQTGLPINPANADLSDAFNAFAAASRDDGSLVAILAKYNLPASAADVGDPRLI